MILGSMMKARIFILAPQREGGQRVAPHPALFPLPITVFQRRTLGNGGQSSLSLSLFAASLLRNAHSAEGSFFPSWRVCQVMVTRPPRMGGQTGVIDCS